MFTARLQEKFRQVAIEPYAPAVHARNGSLAHDDTGAVRAVPAPSKAPGGHADIRGNLAWSIPTSVVSDGYVFVHRVANYLSHDPQTVSQVIALLTAFRRGHINEIHLYVQMYTLLFKADALVLFHLFTRFLPPAWHSANLSWLRKGIRDSLAGKSSQVMPSTLNSVTGQFSTAFQAPIASSFSARNIDTSRYFPSGSRQAKEINPCVPRQDSLVPIADTNVPTRNRLFTPNTLNHVRKFECFEIDSVMGDDLEEDFPPVQPTPTPLARPIAFHPRPSEVVSARKGTPTHVPIKYVNRKRPIDRVPEASHRLAKKFKPLESTLSEEEDLVHDPAKALKTARPSRTGNKARKDQSPSTQRKVGSLPPRKALIKLKLAPPLLRRIQDFEDPRSDSLHAQVPRARDSPNSDLDSPQLRKGLVKLKFPLQNLLQIASSAHPQQVLVTNALQPRSQLDTNSNNDLALLTTVTGSVADTSTALQASSPSINKQQIVPRDNAAGHGIVQQPADITGEVNDSSELSELSEEPSPPMPLSFRQKSHSDQDSREKPSSSSPVSGSSEVATGQQGSYQCRHDEKKSNGILAEQALNADAAIRAAALGLRVRK